MELLTWLAILFCISQSAMFSGMNLALTTTLWGNVGIIVLLTMLSDSVLAGIGAFWS